MNEQEVLNQIRELQKQRISLKEQDTALLDEINELKDKLASKNIKKGYYTDNHGLYCRILDIEEGIVSVYEIDTFNSCIVEEVYPYYKAFNDTYCRECTKEEYDRALDCIIKHFKD